MFVLWKDLENALICLQREDPSLKVRVDPDSGQVCNIIIIIIIITVVRSQSQSKCFVFQTILCGMGELHIEIIHDRIRREHGIETHLGPLQVAYRETILSEVSTTGSLFKSWYLFIDGRKKTQIFT